MTKLRILTVVGTVMMTGLSWGRVEQGLAILELGRMAGRQPRIVVDYAAPHVSQTVARAILSHTANVNHVLWGRY